MKTVRRIMFLRDNSYQPVGCIAYSLSKDKKVVKYQVSVLNPVDHFNRALARQIALGRLIETPIKLNNPSVLTNGVDVVSLIMNDLMMRESVPMRARKAAKLWLTTDTKTITMESEG